ncbi:MAG: hypothetical protein WBD24_00365 [Candidatus Omnitrophota bacterium]
MRGIRIKVAVVLLAFALLASGCAQLKDKFVRKPKETDEARRYHMVKDYDVKPSIELYTKRYIFWKTWHKELVEQIMQGNHKKIVVAVEQDVSNLYDMKRMLVDEKGDQLQPFIVDMEDMENTIKNSRITRANRARIRMKLESIGRGVKKDFSYNKIKYSLRDEFRTE